MTERRDFRVDDGADHGLEPVAARRVAEALKAAMGSAPAVSPELEARILREASGRLGELRRRAEVRRVPTRLPWKRWAPALATAAGLATLLWWQTADHRTGPRDVPLDLDGTGRVDVLDAFFLARQIQQGARPDPRWDVDGDGRVARGDVDRLARAAVRLPVRIPLRRLP